jgi:hypothetical protein
MKPRISQCIICGKFFASKKELREHKDKNHRITNSKIVPGGKTRMLTQVLQKNLQAMIRK